MKIFHAAETIQGGVATILEELINQQSREFGEDKVFYLIPKSQECYINLNLHTKNTFLRTGRNMISFFKFYKAFSHSIKNEDFDVIHLHSSFAGILGRLALFFNKKNYKKVIYCPHAFSFIMNGSFIKKYFYSLIERILLINTDYVICVSHYEKDVATEYNLNPIKLKVVYNGVSGFPLLNPVINKYRSDDIVRVLFVGRFDHQKGIDILIKAVKKLSKESVNGRRFIFNIVGDFVNDHNDTEIFKQTFSSVVELNLLGWLGKKELGYLYNESHVVVMPSRWEGFGLVAVESFQYGTPVIACDNTSLKEIVVDGYNGYKFETDNYHQLCDILINMDFSELSGMSKNCIDCFSLNYTSKNMVDNVRNLYTN